MVDGITPHEVMLRARGEALEAYQAFERNAVERLSALADADRRDDRIDYLLARFTLVPFHEPDIVFVVGRSDTPPIPLTVGFARIIPADALGPRRVEDTPRRAVGLRYQLRPSGEVEVALVDPRPPGGSFITPAIELEILASAKDLSDRTLRRHWRYLCAYMQVWWTDGCPTWWTKWRIRNFRYRSRHSVNTFWQPSKWTEHRWVALRWLLMVGCSGVVVVIGQGFVQHFWPPTPPEDTVSTTIKDQAGKDRHDIAAANTALNQLHVDLSQLRADVAALKPTQSPSDGNPDTTHIKATSRPPTKRRPTNISANHASTIDTVAAPSSKGN